jgi:hypothetical protein
MLYIQALARIDNCRAELKVKDAQINALREREQTRNIEHSARKSHSEKLPGQLATTCYIAVALYLMFGWSSLLAVCLMFGWSSLLLLIFFQQHNAASAMTWKPRKS